MYVQFFPLKQAAKPTIFAIRYRARYLIRHLVRYQMLSQISINNEFIIFLLQFQGLFFNFLKGFFQSGGGGGINVNRELICFLILGKSRQTVSHNARLHSVKVGQCKRIDQVKACFFYPFLKVASVTKLFFAKKYSLICN